MLRARFKKEIVAEFLPSAFWRAPKIWGGRYVRTKAGANERLIILCDGMPSIPRKHDLMEFLSKKGFFVIYPRYRGAWESSGVFLRKSPHQDILDVISELKKEIRDLAFGQKFKINPKEIFIIGGSFGGPAAVLCSIDSRVKKAVAVCPVVDWSILPLAESVETRNKSYVAYINQAFGRAYNLSQKEWNKLHQGNFYNPIARAKEINPKKVIMFHAKDDPVVTWKSVNNFSKLTGVPLTTQKRGGHIPTNLTIPKYWKKIKKFFDSK